MYSVAVLSKEEVYVIEAKRQLSIIMTTHYHKLPLDPTAKYAVEAKKAMWK